MLSPLTLLFLAAGRTAESSRWSAAASDLGERTPAAFVHSAIDVEASSLVGGVRGARIASRFKIFRLRPPACATEQDRAVRNGLVKAMEEPLGIHAHRPGTLVEPAAYLHARTGARIGSLRAAPVREAALVAILGITRRLPADIEVGQIAGQATRPPARRITSRRI